MEGHKRRSAQPRFIVHTAGNGTVFLVSDVIPKLHVPRLGHQDLADFPGLHIFDGPLRHRTASRLRAKLYDALVSSRGRDHETPFAKVVRCGLLHVDVLACVASENRCRSVPVIRRGNHERVDTLVVEDAAHVGDQRQPLAMVRLDGFRSLIVDVRVHVAMFRRGRGPVSP